MKEPVVHPYIPNSAPETKAAMLKAVGADSVEDFFEDIPAELRVKGLLNLPPAVLAEEELKKLILGKLRENDPDRLMFLGQGTFPHGTPAVVAEVINRSEFLTAYAGEPYEDHGRFQALFEYQSLMGELLSCDVVTVPTYDGYQATATALAITQRLTNRSKVLVVSDVLQDKHSKINDFLRKFTQLEIVPSRNGIADLDLVRARIDSDVSCVFIESPSAFGAVETNIRELAEIAHEVGAFCVVSTDPIMAGVIEPPANQGADITCGDIQSLGIGQWFGGAHGGFIAMADEERLVMELPSRLFGLASTSVEGEYGFGDVAYDRTSFATREEGKEWVGTAAALWGIAAAVYLSLMGPRGMQEVGETIFQRTRYLQSRLASINGFEIVNTGLNFREVLVRTPHHTASILAASRLVGMEAGVAIDENTLCICVTEQHNKQDIDRLIEFLTELEEIQ
jgi:glycine dehydrogenase subunit 1